MIDQERMQIIERFMISTYERAKELDISLSVNPKTKKMGWSLIKR